MRRITFPLAAMIAIAAVTLPVPAASEDAASDSARAALEAELEALLAEIEAPPGGDPFEEEGRSPDLIVVSTNTVLGEVAPCG